jgi:large subunit ribosomal protein L15
MKENKMRLNTLKPARGSKQKNCRVGRGCGSGLGKTCGRGHKGQHARAGGLRKVGFEGGQMPLQRRLPKVGFFSAKSMRSAEIRLSDLDKIQAEIINIEILKNAQLINHTISQVKVIATGKLTKAVKLSGLLVTKGARASIESAGGTVGD